MDDKELNMLQQEWLKLAIKKHRQLNMGLGDVVRTWQDEDGVCCVEYSNGQWFHYRGQEWW